MYSADTILFIYFYLLIQVLKVCRTPGPIACLKMLNKVILKQAGVVYGINSH